MNDGPGGGADALPEGVVFRVLRNEVFRFAAEVGDGTGLGRGERAARVICFKIGHRLGEEGTEYARDFHEESLQREATLLVEEADVAGGKAGGLGRRVVNDGDAEAMAVAHEGCFERAEGLEMAEGVVGSEDDKGVGLWDPVIREGAGGFDEGAKRRRDLKVEEGVRGELEQVVGSEENPV